ncbi:unnamed protein product [Phytomonas sp. Hart1]|nr:unnamed protein product [Phytomonas sp. Hart1]|eukprot:CCW72081.1 unnamed protein product [Phytomonas sp. isolate Hart1]
MRRFLHVFSAHHSRCVSYAASIFNYKAISDELIPFPSHKLENDEMENTQTLIEQIRSNDKELSTAGARIAVEYGGLGLGHTAHALVCEELGTCGNRKLLSAIQHCTMASYLLSTFSSSKLKGKYLTSMSDGTAMMGWAVKEEFGTDLSMNTTTATFEKGVYRIKGEKICHYGENATHFLVMAKTMTQVSTEGGPKELSRNSFFVVKNNNNHEYVRMNKNHVTFDSAPAEDVIGVVGEAFRNSMITLFTEEYAYAAALLGTLKRVVQELRSMVPDRWATTTVASCACSIYAMESALYALTACLDIQTEDSLLEAALVNAFVQTTTNEWLTLLSTATPTTEALEKCFVCARTLLEMMESSDFLYSTAVCYGVEDFGLNFQRTTTLQLMQARLLRTFNLYERLPLKEIDCTPIEKAIVNFGNAVESAFVRNTTRLSYQQLLINRLGEAAGLIYIATAVASRASMSINKRIKTAHTEKQLAEAFIISAMERVNILSSECCNTGLTADDSYMRIALELCEDALQ